MSVSYKKQTHKSKGKAGKKPHPSGMSPHSGARKNRLTKALREREERVAQRKMDKNKPRPKKKPTPPKVPTIGGASRVVKRRPTTQEQRDAGASVIVDYEQLDKMAGGGLIGGQKKLDANKDGKISGADFEMMGANRKKYGGKITYKMAGGQVVDSSYD